MSGRSLQEIGRMVNGDNSGVDNALTRIWLKSHPTQRQQNQSTYKPEETPRYRQSMQAAEESNARQAQAVQSLFDKAIRGGNDSMGNPILSASQTGNGIIGYDAVPVHVREAVGDMGNIIGWDWESLNGDERNILTRLVGPEYMARQQRAKRAVEQESAAKGSDVGPVSDASDPRWLPRLESLSPGNNLDKLFFPGVQRAADWAWDKLYPGDKEKREHLERLKQQQETQTG